MTDLLADLAERERQAAHSIFSPSAASMWTTCPGSLVPNALAPDHTTADAAEGTVAHTLAEQWLRTGERPAAPGMVLQEGYWIDANDAMLAYVEQYVDWCNEQDGDRYVEQKLKAAPGLYPIPDQGGTVDFAALRSGHAGLIDLKYGKGIRVYAEDNPQLLTYAVYLFDQWDWFYDFQTISISICQPRLDHFDTWTVSREDLIRFRRWLKVRAVDAWRLDAPRSPGEKACQWCKVKKNCPAYLSWFRDIAENAADDAFGVSIPEEMAYGFAREHLDVSTARADDPFQDPFDLPELTVEQWCRILPMRKAVEAWFAAGEAKVFGAASAGFETPGWKIVEGRSNRVWGDETKAQARMVEVGIPLDETETRKLLSPNQAEEALHARTRMSKTKARQLFDSHTERKDGGLSLVRQNDKREAVPSHGDVFDD